MSRALILRLAVVQQEFAAAHASLTFVEKQWDSATEDDALTGVTKTQVAVTLGKVEQTYLTRLFSEFEGMLKAYLDARRETIPPRACDLINKAAKRQRANVPDARRDAVHLVREYRNVIVHDQGISGAAISFRQALSALDQYLVYFPDP